MKIIYRFIIICLLLSICVSCTSNKDSKVLEKENTTLLLSAAASLSDVMEQVIASFQEEYSDIKVEVNYAASGTLQRQIEQGAPADVFISAGEKQMAALVEQGLVEQAVPLLSNQLVIVSASEPETIADRTLQQLLLEADPTYIALGEPDTVPAGQYAKQALEQQQLWSAWEDHYVYGKDVRQVLAYVEQGNAELGFVYKTDALSSPRVHIIHTVDETKYDPIIYPLAIVSSTKAPDAAQLFYQFLRQEQLTASYEQFGFKVAR